MVTIDARHPKKTILSSRPVGHILALNLKNHWLVTRFQPKQLSCLSRNDMLLSILHVLKICIHNRLNSFEKSLPTYNLPGILIGTNMSKVLKSPIGIAFLCAFKRWDELGHNMYGRPKLDITGQKKFPLQPLLRIKKSCSPAIMKVCKGQLLSSASLTTAHPIK